MQHFCPACSTPVQPEAAECSHCPAVFTPRTGLKPTDQPQHALSTGAAHSGFALLLIFIAFCLLSLAFALKGSELGTTPPLILALIFGAFGCVIAIAKSRTARNAATFAGVTLLALLVLFVVAVMLGLSAG